MVVDRAAGTGIVSLSVNLAGVAGLRVEAGTAGLRLGAVDTAGARLG